MNEHTEQQRREEEPHVINSAMVGGQCHRPALSDLTEKTMRAAQRLHKCACEFEEPGPCGEYFEHLQTCMEELEQHGAPVDEAARLLAVLEES